MTCEKCGRETPGVRKRGPGHPTVPYCRICFYPKRFAWCACGDVKGAKAKAFMICIQKARIDKKVEALNKQLEVLAGKKRAKASPIPAAPLPDASDPGGPLL